MSYSVVKMMYTAVGHEYPDLEEEDKPASSEPESSAPEPDPEPEPEPEPVYPNRVVFVALGTRGDVQPVLAVALAYARAHRSCDVVLATHVELHGVMERLILIASGDNRCLVSLSPIRSGARLCLLYALLCCCDAVVWDDDSIEKLPSQSI